MPFFLFGIGEYEKTAIFRDICANICKIQLCFGVFWLDSWVVYGEIFQFLSFSVLGVCCYVSQAVSKVSHNNVCDAFCDDICDIVCDTVCDAIGNIVCDN